MPERLGEERGRAVRRERECTEYFRRVAHDHDRGCRVTGPRADVVSIPPPLTTDDGCFIVRRRPRLGAFVCRGEHKVKLGRSVTAVPSQRTTAMFEDVFGESMREGPVRPRPRGVCLDHDAARGEKAGGWTGWLLLFWTGGLLFVPVRRRAPTSRDDHEVIGAHGCVDVSTHARVSEPPSPERLRAALLDDAPSRPTQSPQPPQSPPRRRQVPERFAVVPHERLLRCPDAFLRERE